MATKKRKTAPGDVATNRKASHRYFFLDKVEAGMVLTGTEVKALRGGKAVIKDGFASISDGELWLHNVHRADLDQLADQTREKGLTLVPTRIYFSNGRAKVEIAVARGKDVGDKRQTIKEREMKRDMERALRER